MTLKPLFLAASLTLLATSFSYAATIANSVSIVDGGPGVGACGSTPSQSDSGSDPVKVSLNDGGLNCTVTADAFAGGGVIAYRATSTFDRFIGPAGSALIQGGARSVMSGLFLTPLFDITDAAAIAKYGYQVDLQLNAVIEGTATASVANDVGQAGAGSRITATVTLGGIPSPGNTTSKSAIVRGGAGATYVNLLSDFDNFGQAIQPRITHDWRESFSVIFNMSTDVSAGGFEGNQTTATLDAFNSLSFSKTGPALILPDGFTFNAPELNILDNRWVDPRIIDDPSPVPLPAGLPLMLAGLGAFGVLRRYK